ncbi:MAG: AbrB/MazE/SpoVT family DNA-binding domain-containing protein [Proteobacteria bacterium]|jgi:putative addiction module antidote|nr:AbrB/MazE/SpoVT family DNA-binding domain-containing protein [Pseudomonadota bacterium]MDA0951965.1 AbrB/MazE/SpoVT family DNA-binding domain-containing protein [Pseudomonadota bacterium]MDA1072474.1 AbrB/MazE/SpoVT family DNA-binding domain-containing protein [Pseudomonadota bacterium]
MDQVKVRRVGNSLGVTLTEQCRQMGVAEGDTLYVVRTEQGIELRPGDDAFARAVAAGRDLMKRYPNAMRELAK